MIAEIKIGGMRKEEIARRLEMILGRGSGQEIETATMIQRIVERIEDMSKRRAV